MNRLSELSITYHALKDANAMLLKRLSSDAMTTDQIFDALCEHMGRLARDIAAAQSTSTEEISYKASVALDWLDTRNPDVAQELALSLCRDILRLFPFDGEKPPVGEAQER